MVRLFKLTLFALFCFAAVGQFVWTGAHSQDKPAEKFFKNIQALKGVPYEQIAGLMDSYNKALGVGCEYCHVQDLSKADKPTHKLSVRDILMTREINEKYRHSVDCMSCHQGKAKPTTTFLAKGNTGPGTKPPDKAGPTKPEPDKTEPAKPDPAKAEAEPPAKVSFPANFSGSTKVLFPHDTHMSIDCAKCHHTGENNKCDTCHLHNKKTSAVTKVSFYAAAHGTKNERNCTGCHLQMKTGPTKCAECHKK